MDPKNIENMDQYIAQFPEEVQIKLRQIRNMTKEIEPEAVETISYAIPTFKLNGNLIHFAAFKNHIGFYPAPQGIEAFKKELSNYKGAKGSVQFPLDQELPLQLIAKIIKYRAKQQMLKKKKVK